MQYPLDTLEIDLMVSYESLVITKKIALILLGIGTFVCSILFASSEGNFLFDKVVVVFAVFCDVGLRLRFTSEQC